MPTGTEPLTAVHTIFIFFFFYAGVRGARHAGEHVPLYTACGERLRRRVCGSVYFSPHRRVGAHGLEVRRCPAPDAV